MAGKLDFFAADDCTGPLVGTATETANRTSKFVATIDTSVAFTPTAAGVMSKIDQVTTSVPQSSTVYTGSGFYHTVRDGIPAVCIDFSVGNFDCGYDGVQPAESGIAEGLLLQGDTLYTLLPSSSGYTVELKYTKKTN